MTHSRQNSVRIYAMGGVGEIGSNMTVIEINRDIYVVDAGLMHPHEDMLGVDTVIPDISYLIENRDRVQAVLLTHGHQANIGGLPYLFKELAVPIYGTRLTLALVKEALKELGQNFNREQFIAIQPEQDLMIGSCKVSFFRTYHSVPDSIGLSIHSPQGNIVHTGDYKFDFTPVGGYRTDVSKISEIGDEGVLCMLGDSKHAELPGKAPSDAEIGERFNHLLYSAAGRVIMTVHATNLYRIQQFVEACVRHGRKIVFEGKYLEKVISIAVKEGFLVLPENSVLSWDKASKIPTQGLAIVTSGPDGDPLTPLTGMANHLNKRLRFKENDLIIYAASLTPSNEKTVTNAIDQLMSEGTQVVFGKSVHVSGHGSAEDLKLMLQLVRPKYLLPIDGEFKMLKTHQELAESMGITPERVFLLDKGDVVTFTNGEARQSDTVPAGQLLVDGLGIGDVGNIVLRDRRLLSQDGTVIVVVTLGRKNKKILAGPEIITRGFVYVRESEDLLDQANQIVSEVLSKALTQHVSEWSSLKSGIRDALSRYFFDKTRRRPMILPIIMEF
ncbi:ribonuclease J [Sporolactobacillus spathodeae]|uniref:Ribonuclease J n=1 Tax=Sporolactobacillus spathodeae TaxID=1465502 RepID=A0ABS2Q5F9_9BACL|nr:ribonuclease J [Sporolactobacillus spathodeae]MBM7657010.1 ribonuclease J [Sporolactobacillus spathodeae]